ncbi:hypothetical protein GCM10009037_15210 [Halarchaeum grantii]|uniref:Uncharacterized protein n=1 Tax=Halarchaeum grantii TaxID=1193105 RepID=A0A830F9E9_9EURY|nr:hypothetical protein [Halarchaeum grantii]GGL32533.1 hypothetical protein GCM10009037_15210 [Halarchaeum grantii]
MRVDPFPDQRARIPFAVIGALLLVTSATLATGIAVKPSQTGYDAGPAIGASWSAAGAAAERAALTASVDAARSPVVAVANTSYGRALNASQPFRDALRLRIYVGVRDALAASPVTVEGVRAVASLPPIETPADARAAVERVTLAGVDDGSALRVHVRDVTVTATRNGAVIERIARPLVVTAPTPVLAVHGRVATFEERLNTGVFAGSGLARRATASLTVLAETRGLAQYGGAPVDNVVANRHVALVTNRGVVALQRAAFGAADPDARAATRRAAVATAGRDALAGVGVAAANANVTAANGSSAAATVADATADLHPGAASPQPVPLAPVADDAFVASVDGGGFDAALSRAYAVDVRLATRVGDANASVAAPPTPAGYRHHATLHRTVSRDNRTRAVAVTVGVRLHTDAALPVVGDDSRWLASAAVRRAVRSALPDSVGERALDGALDDSFTVEPTVSGARRAAALDALAETHATLRTVTSHVDRRSFLDGEPLASLTTAVDAAVDTDTAGATTLRERAAVAVRASYADRVRALVEDRRSTLARAQSRIGDALAERDVPTTPPPVAGPAAPPVAMRVSSEPAYLSLARVTPTDAAVESAHYPLGARNTNLATIPSEDLADAVLDIVFGDRRERVALATAAGTLRAADEVPVADAGLRRGVSASVESARDGLDTALDTHTALSANEREQALDAGFGQYGTVAARGLAVANGSVAESVAAAANEREGGRSGVLAARLRVALRDLESSGALSVGESTVSSARASVESSVRDAAHRAVADATQSAGERAVERSALRLLPAGIPLLPLPGQWYVTVNAWDVAAHGGYERFEVAAALGRPGVGDGSLRYVREDAPVAVDVDGDGVPETLGRNARLDFAYRTGVVVVVPPGPRGVGDVGDADERSAGW